MSENKKISVFAFDDDPGDLVLLSRYLDDITSWEIDFHSASSWADGKDALQCSECDIIFLDYPYSSFDF